MTRAASWACAAALVCAGCATIGDETAFPAPVESGIGPFRLLDADETSVSATPEGRVIPAAGAFGRTMRFEQTLIYAMAEVLSEPPDRNGDLPDFVIDPAQTGPNRIFALDVGAFDGGSGGEVAFEADADWQGGEVFDPWLLRDAGGDLALYFAGAGGIGVTRGSLGAFGLSTLILEDARSPSVVTLAGTTYLFFERDGAVGVATLDGDTANVLQHPLDLGDAPGTVAETAQLRPGAVVAESALERRAIWLYFESRFEDGTSAISVSATADAVSFDRSEEVLVDAPNAGEPCPVRADGITLLYGTHAFRSSGTQRRVPFGALAPLRTQR
ncbi:MAG: hypothetical protein AAF645_11900 [Myxococcota bacterium]